MIGGGEALGQVTASYVYSRYSFSAECDVFNVAVLVSFGAVLFLECCSGISKKFKGKSTDSSQ